MADHIVVEDSDDRPERMRRDPKRYFDEARRRAEAEILRHREHLRHRSAAVSYNA
jgi:hypothetical protein